MMPCRIRKRLLPPLVTRWGRARLVSPTRKRGQHGDAEITRSDRRPAGGWRPGARVSGLFGSGARRGSEGSEAPPRPVLLAASPPWRLRRRDGGAFGATDCLSAARASPRAETEAPSAPLTACLRLVPRRVLPRYPTPYPTSRAPAASLSRLAALALDPGPLVAVFGRRCGQGKPAPGKRDQRPLGGV
jgi:hypothetical protein